MSKNKLRKVHIDEKEWKYSVDYPYVNIWIPNDKSKCHTFDFEVWLGIGPDGRIYDDIHQAVCPSDIKQYILENLT